MNSEKEAIVDAEDYPNALEQMRRMAFDRGKWLQTKTSIISQYDFTYEDLDTFFNGFKEVIRKVKEFFRCPICSHSLVKATALVCGHCVCYKCSQRWLRRKNKCPSCDMELSRKPFAVFAIDEIIKEMGTFNKEFKLFQKFRLSLLKEDYDPKVQQMLKRFNFVLLQRLRNTETQLMCDFCLKRLQHTYLANCTCDGTTFRPLCQGCDKRYVEFYEESQGATLEEPFPFPLLDKVVSAVYEYMESILDYCSQHGKSIRKAKSSGIISFASGYKLILVGLIGISILLWLQYANDFNPFFQIFEQ